LLLEISRFENRKKSNPQICWLAEEDNRWYLCKQESEGKKKTPIRPMTSHKKYTYMIYGRKTNRQMHNSDTVSWKFDYIKKPGYKQDETVRGDIHSDRFCKKSPGRHFLFLLNPPLPFCAPYADMLIMIENMK